MPAQPPGRPSARSGLTNRFRAQSRATEGDNGKVGRTNESNAGAGAPQTSEIDDGVSEDDLRVIAEHGYEGAASTDHDQREQAVSLFITDKLAPRSAKGNGVTRVATSFRYVSPPLQRRFSRPENSVGPVPPPVAGPRAGA